MRTIKTSAIKSNPLALIIFAALLLMSGKIAVQAESKIENRQLTAQFFNVPANSANLTGDWIYTAMIFADSSVHELRNRDSHIVFESNGNYTNYIYVGNPSGHAGTYSAAGGSLTLNDSVDKTTNTLKMSSDGDDKLTLIGDDGSGWKLERR